MRLFIMSGGFGSGKTTWIGRMLDAARGLGVDVAGLYTPAVFEGDQKAAIDAVLLPEGERFLFAPRRATQDSSRCSLWDFQDDALAQCNEHLATCAGCGLLVIDELGPMEFGRGGGFTNGMRLLDEQACGNALVVVRPTLLPQAEQRWGDFTLLDPGSSVEEFLDSL